MEKFLTSQTQNKFFICWVADFYFIKRSVQQTGVIEVSLNIFTYQVFPFLVCTSKMKTPISFLFPKSGNFKYTYINNKHSLGHDPVSWKCVLGSAVPPFAALALSHSWEYRLHRASLISWWLAGTFGHSRHMHPTSIMKAKSLAEGKLFYRQHERAFTDERAFPKPLLCHIYKYLTRQNEFHDQAQIPGMERKTLPLARKSDQVTSQT